MTGKEEIDTKNPNGYGSISKLSGNRRKPYRVRVTTGYTIGADGKSKQIQRTVGTFATWQEAVDALVEYNKNPVSLEPGVTFAEIYKRWSEERFAATKENTQRVYIAAYNAVPMLHNMAFRDIRTVHLQNAVDTCGKNLPTLQNVCIVIGGMYDYAMANDIVAKDYSQYINLAAHRATDKERKKKTPPKHKAFSEEEVAVLWEHRDDAFVRELLMLIYSGLRIKEYIELPTDNVDIPARILTLDDAKTDAGIRIVPIAEKTVGMWEELLDRRRRFADKRSYMTKYEHFQRDMIDKMTEIGLQKHLPHDTRHTTTTILRKRKADPLLVKRIIGHRIPDITERVYTHTDIEELIRTINLM